MFTSNYFWSSEILKNRENVFKSFSLGLDFLNKTSTKNLSSVQIDNLISLITNSSFSSLLSMENHKSKTLIIKESLQILIDELLIFQSSLESPLVKSSSESSESTIKSNNENLNLNLNPLNENESFCKFDKIQLNHQIRILRSLLGKAYAKVWVL